MRVKTVEKFKDLEADKIREPEEKFSVIEKRYKKLKSLGLVELVEESETTIQK